MTDWHFLVVRHFGGRHQRLQTCAQIKRQVEQHGLSNVLPLIKYESNRTHEYYLGLAYDPIASVNEKTAEDTARQVLVDAGISTAANRELSWAVEADEVKRFLSGTLGCDSFTIPILYESESGREALPIGQLLSEVNIGELSSIAPTAEQTEQYSRLLYWCSAIGSGGLDRIRQVSQILGINNDWRGAWSILRRLILLGHLEFDGGDALRWSVIPPTLVTLAEGGDQRILVGQRTPAIVQYLSEGLSIEEVPQPNGPPRLLARNIASDVSYRPGYQARDVGCVSRQLADLLPDLDNWILRLPTWEERDFRRFSIEKYDPWVDELHQVSAILDTASAGLYRFTIEQTQRRVVTVAFFDDRAHRWICGDYYGLRFLARARHGLCRAVYHERARQLIIPASDHWPMPYERALVLARGSLPLRLQTESGKFVLTYEGIPPEFAAHMCKLLGLQMEGNQCTI